MMIQGVSRESLREELSRAGLRGGGGMKRLTRVLLRQFARAARPYLQSYGLLRTSKIFNTSCLVWEPGAEKVMVLAPHMDDETIGCGGTLARHVRAGASVTVVFLTDGRHGGGGSV